MHRGRSSAVLAAALAWVVGSACNRGKIAQCNQLIDVANAQEARLNTRMNQMNTSNGDATQTDALAAAFEQAGRQIGAVQLTDPQLQGFSRQYQQVITQFVTVARSMARAQRAQDADSITAEAPQLQHIETQSAAVVNRINQYCQSL